MPCHLHAEITRLTFNTSDGDICRSQTAITLSSCTGYCTALDGLRVRPISGQTSATLNMNAIHDSNCGCCTGLGDWIQQTVDCDRAGTTTVELYKYTHCGCVECESTEVVTQDNMVSAPPLALPPMP